MKMIRRSASRCFKEAQERTKISPKVVEKVFVLKIGVTI